MHRGSRDRGVSEVVGFLLVFGFLVISFTVYQGIVVPDQNRQAEFQHNQAVQGSLQELRNAIVRTASTGSGEAVSVTLGATYPDRTIAQNLGVSTGALQTVDPGGGVSVANVRATDAETRDYLGGSIGPFESRAIRYVPVYSFYDGAPQTIYENTFAYNRFRSTNLTLTDQLLVDGRRITLVTVSGNLSMARRDTVSVSTEAVSVSSNRVLVRNTTGERVTLTLPTTASVSEWEDVLADEMAPAGNVVGVSAVPGADAVNVTLRRGPTYELRMAKVGIGTGAAAEGATYLTDVDGNGSTVTAGGTHELVVEVRDRYNNPVSGVPVNVTGVSGGGSLDPANSVRSDADGRASFTYTAPGSSGPETVTLAIDDGSPDRESVTFSLTVQGGSGGSGTGGGNGAYDLFWQQPSGDQGLQGPCDPQDCTWDLDADNDDRLTLVAETKPELDGMPLNFAVDNATVARVDAADSETDGNGEGTVALQAGTNGPVSVFVASGGDSDRINLTVEGLDLIYNEDAVASPGSDSNVDSVVEFSLTNQGPDPLTVTAVTIDSATAGDEVFEREGGRNEVMIDANQDGDLNDAVDGYADDGNGFDVGDQIPLDDTATLSSGASADVTFYEFSSGPIFARNPVDMSGEELTVTIHYQDPGGTASTRTVTIQIP